ncbi:uncharacterized protein FIBRA_05666 [Fibroporia radiculosa]|uniref:Amidohydrolase-related domain-containing protein n=1 Tax=Fibroporia radiculosa TaxID=599839 RepID=J4HXX4_9APHY|nr:uncharacterized protein FIBRA_05666 [Fibroporia radiculosa]CCM03532.1 predicted protein [Fibroporia radiculosa]
MQGEFLVPVHSANEFPEKARQVLIRNVYLHDDSSVQSSPLYDVICTNGKVHDVRATSDPTNVENDDTYIRGSIDSEDVEILDAEGKGILVPALCHAHIHLDKCFLLGKSDELVSGDFAEALKVTAQAKGNFPSALEDLYNRGSRLIVESVECGVTAMRAHVEVDETVHMSCLDVGLRLKKDYETICDVQIAVFAQDPLFSAQNAELGDNLILLQNAAARDGVHAVGSAPYVEPSVAQAKRNIRFIFDIACTHGLHADFHLDYTLDRDAEPLIWYVLDELRTRMRTGRWPAGARVCVGHATRLTLFSAEEWAALAHAVHPDGEGLPLALVGLPPSDVYMMARGAQWELARPRGTLDVVRLARVHALPVAMAVNNVENAFTPQGVLDPLALCPLGVALFQSGTRADAARLVVRRSSLICFSRGSLALLDTLNVAGGRDGKCTDRGGHERSPRAASGARGPS